MGKKLLILSLGLILIFAGLLPADFENRARDGVSNNTLNVGRADLPRGTPLLSEGFESAAWPPTGWSVIQTCTDNSNSIPGWWSQTNYTVHTGNYAAGLWWSYQHQDEWLISPDIALAGPPGASYYVSFWTYGWEGSTHSDHYYVKVSTDNGATWTVLFDLSTLTGNAWNEWGFPYVIDLSAYAGQTIKLAWHAEDPPSNDGLWYIWAIDDVEVGYEGGSDCVWNPGDPHKMHYPQLPDETGWAVNATQPLILADDFLCMQTGWIKDVHWWGAWMNGVPGQIVQFVLSLHADIPADQSPTGYSMPGPTLWEFEVPGMPGTPHDPPTMEGWYDPAQGLVIPDDHQPYFQYDVCLPEQYWFWQDSGTVYWLNVTAIVADPTTTQWGWKSTQDHWNDDAVYAFWGNLSWQEIFEPAQSSQCDTVANAFYAQMLPDGTFGGGGGENPYGDGWYYYPMYDWWNIWFYDHPFTVDNYKAGLIDFDVFRLDPQWPAFFEIAVNWSTDQWSIDFPDDSMPPLPGVPEELYIGRMTLFAGPEFQGHYTLAYVLPDYNPEWVSVDVRGYNFVIPSGVILHACCPKQTPSLDLAFVITGEPPQQETGACCYNPTGGPLTDCIVTTAADCQNLGGVYQGDGTTCTGTQACCLPGGGCINADPLCCINELGGVPQGPGTSCTTPEACCMPDGSCQMMDPICCDDMGGVPLGPGTQCTAIEACCMPDGNCLMVDPLCCINMLGTPQGVGTVCTAPVACCFQDGSCQMLDPLCCDDQGGVPSPIGATTCLGDNNQNGTDDACEEEICDCMPGDANGNLAHNILDVTYLISYLYKGGAAPIPYTLCSGDANCNCAVNILDATYLISYLYKGGNPPCSCEQWLINCGPPLRK